MFKRARKFFKKVWLRFLKRVSYKTYLDKIGVVYDKNNMFQGKPNFGTEPYLIQIGKHVIISCEVILITHEGGHAVLKGLNREKYKDTFGYGRIIIKDNVYIGARTTILRGVTIGENTIIGAHSLVNKSLEPNSVYAGVPARKICTLEEFERKFMSDMPEFDKENYYKHKKDEVLKIVDKFKKR